MIKIEVQKNLLYQRPKIVRQSVSLKKNMISFPIQDSSSPKVVSQSFIYRRLKSPPKPTSQRLKKKVERQMYVQAFQEINSNRQMLMSRQLIRNPESLINISNSHKISNSNTLPSSPYSSNQQYKGRKFIKNARTLQAENCFQSPRISTQLYLKSMDEAQIKNKIGLMKNSRYDLNNFMEKDKKEELLTCKSLKKSSQIDIFKNQMSSLITKKVSGNNNMEEYDFSDQTSFNMILQKIKNYSETSQSGFERRKQKYINKVKNTKIMTDANPQVNQQNISRIKLGTESNIFQSTQIHKKINFRSALEWSNQKVDLMKSPFFKNKGIRNTTMESKKTKRDEFVIEGWVK